MLDPEYPDEVNMFLPHISEAPAQVPKYVLYHKSCTDGFASAFAFWKGQEQLQANSQPFTFIPVSYREPFPNVEPGSWVWIVDFSYETHKMSHDPAKIITLDHHKTSFDRTYPHYPFHRRRRLLSHNADQDRIYYLDMDRSGAGLSWEYVHPNDPMPMTLAAVQDRDLWAWKMPTSEAITLGLDSYDMDFEEWDKVIWRADKLEERGTIIRDYRDNQIQRALSTLTWKTDKKDRTVPLVNDSQLPSEIGAHLYNTFHVPYAIVWYQRKDDQIYLSFRSRPGEGDNVAALAEGLGGGGHMHAAGAVVSRRVFEENWEMALWYEPFEKKLVEINLT